MKKILLTNFFTFILLASCLNKPLWAQYERIISLCPATTQNLYLLEQQNHLIGLTRYCPIPEKDKNKAVIGDLLHINVEQITLLKPDLIIGLEEINNTPKVKRLKELGFEVFLLPPHKDWESLSKAFLMLSGKLGLEDKGKRIVQKHGAIIDAYIKKSEEHKPYRIFCQLDSKPLITIGQKSYLHQMLTQLGGSNIFSDQKQNYLRVSPHSVLLRQPDVILIIDTPSKASESQSFWQNLLANTPHTSHQSILRLTPQVIGLPTPSGASQAIAALYQLIFRKQV